MENLVREKFATEQKRFQEEIRIIDAKYRIERARIDERKQRELEAARQRHGVRLRHINSVEVEKD